MTCDASQLMLYLAKKPDGAWLGAREDDAIALQRSFHIYPGIASMVTGETLMVASATLDACFSTARMPEIASTGQIHILVELGELESGTRECPVKRTKRSAEADREYLLTIADAVGDLLIASSSIFDVETVERSPVAADAIANILRFIDDKHFVRLETRKIFEAFETIYCDEFYAPECTRDTHQFVLEGADGVDKSTILALLCFWVAINRKHPVLLLHTYGAGLKPPLVFLFDDNKYYKWEHLDLQVFKAVYGAIKLTSSNFWACVDGFSQEQIEKRGLDNWFRVVASSGWYDVKNHRVAIMCLVPIWTETQLKSYGSALGYADQQMHVRYFHSGNSLQDFLFKTFPAYNTVHCLLSSDQVLMYRVLMKTVVDVTKCQCYTSPGSWIDVTSSKYDMTLAAAFARPSVFKRVMDDSRRLVSTGDDGDSQWRMRDLVFKGYFHTLVLQKKKTLRLHAYEYYGYDGDDDEAPDSATKPLSSNLVVQLNV